jgi:hypothetical protein
LVHYIHAVDTGVLPLFELFGDLLRRAHDTTVIRKRPREIGDTRSLTRVTLLKETHVSLQALHVVFIQRPIRIQCAKINAEIAADVRC